MIKNGKALLLLVPITVLLLGVQVQAFQPPPKSPAPTKKLDVTAGVTSRNPTAPNSPSPSAANDGSVNNNANTSEHGEAGEVGSRLTEWMNWILGGIVVLVIIAGIVVGILSLRKRFRGQRDEIAKKFSDIRRKFSDLNLEVTALGGVTKNLSEQLAKSKAEIAALKDANRNRSADAVPPPPVPPAASHEPPKPEPQFPISADDFIAKSKNGAVPVRYDYKDGMLVADEAREGGLMVVRDGSDGRLYLVPSFGIFQMKSDYTNYFERYYACVRPAGGTVWIIQPATVSQVNGGWQLLSRGELEVR